MIALLTPFLPQKTRIRNIRDIRTREMTPWGFDGWGIQAISIETVLSLQTGLS
jgi:hypothetical protein